jgi:hypothetical protein
MGTLVTHQDLDMLSWLGRHRFASVPQVARWTRRPVKVAYRRLAALRQLDLVAYERPTLHHGVYVATRAGLRVAGLELPTATVDIRCFHHDRAVLDLALDLGEEGEVLVTEREMRHADEAAVRAKERPTYGVALPARGGVHYPDLAVELDTGRIRAVEVERTAKNRARLERILAGYARARHVAEVVYYVPGARVGDHVTRTARSVGAETVVSVVTWPGWGRLPEAV